MGSPLILAEERPLLASRRRCLAVLLALVAPWSGMALDPWPGRAGYAGIRRALIEVLGDPVCARAIGQACLCALPAAERTSDRLVAAIGGAVPLDGAASEVRRLIRQRVRRDFAEGSIVRVEGWILSLTEARLYALAALA